jgi:hypothetical protein
MTKKNKFALFIVCLIALIAFQAKVIMPWVMDVVASDLFLNDEPTEQEKSESGQMLGYAFDQCNLYISSEVDSDVSVSYASDALNSWDIGGHQYVINANIDLMPENGSPLTARYVCRIKFTGDDSNQAEFTNADNWSVSGVSGLDDYL